MKRFLQTNYPFGVLLFFLTIFYLWGIQFVPFHPDESTQLYMSSDFEALFSSPSSLFWKPNHENDPRQRYRELDAPLTKYILGLGRRIAGLPALPVDWDWSKSWDENVVAGAYDEDLLFIGRLSITLLLPLSMIFIYLTGVQIQGRATGLVGALLLGSHALALLHGRRGMAEGALLFGITLVLWSILQGRERPWLTGLGVAIAFNAKQSALALFPIGLLAVCWLPANTTQHFRKIATNAAKYLLVFILITIVLNPLYWSNPWRAARASLATRGDLIQQQIADMENIAPKKVLDTPMERITVMIANLFISPPTYGLVGNLAPIREDIDAYIAIPGHNLFRGFVWGGILLTVMILGVYLAVREIWCRNSSKRRELFLLLMASLLQAATLIIAVPLPWPRYSIPLVPFECLWIAYGIAKLKDLRS